MEEEKREYAIVPPPDQWEGEASILHQVLEIPETGKKIIIMGGCGFIGGIGKSLHGQILAMTQVKEELEAGKKVIITREMTDDMINARLLKGGSVMKAPLMPKFMPEYITEGNSRRERRAQERKDKKRKKK